MIIEKQNSNFETLLQRLEELKNQSIFQAHHTHGTMFLFDMGPKTEKITYGRLGFHGANTVIVENYTWKIIKKGEIIVDSKKESITLRRKIPVLVGKKIIDIKFNRRKDELAFIFSNDITLQVRLSEKKDRDLGIKLSNSNWIDIGPSKTWCQITQDHVG